jgi:hypothetical protein
MKFIIPTLIYSAGLPALISGTGVFQAICQYKNAVDGSIWNPAADTQACCDSIGGGAHYYDDPSCSCRSTGGSSKRRVWIEAFDACCKSKGPFWSTSCNDYCDLGQCFRENDTGKKA